MTSGGGGRPWAVLTLDESVGRWQLRAEPGSTRTSLNRFEVWASLARLCDVVAALGVEVREEVSLPSKDAA
jgi:hypothetical protein